MIKYIRVITIIILSATAFGGFAQNSATTSSPYSQFGLGDYSESLLPQNRAMGGIGAGVGKSPDGLSVINIINPASYSNIHLTAIDIGAYVNTVSLSRTGYSSETSNNFRLNHIAFGIPVSHRSALSFGILPYTNMGYSYQQTNQVALNRGPIGVDTSVTQQSIYSGDGGFSKAYMGYGISFGNFSIGGNISYIFGKQKQLRDVVYPTLPSVLNTRIENSMSVGGFNYDYGVQYDIKTSNDSHVTLGYSGSANSQLNTTNNYVVSHYLLSTDGSGTPNNALDSTTYTSNQGKLTLPQINRFGITYVKDSKLVLGADFKTGQWSALNINGTNAGLQNSQTIAVGGQITPNINSLHSYLDVIDYRFGFSYDNTFVVAGGQNIKQYAATIGLGLPIPNQTRTNFYKVNIAAEIGQRGTLSNNLVKENYINIHLGFTINEKWFQKYKFD